MDGTGIKTVRLPAELIERAQDEADALGVSFNEFTVYALGVALGGQPGDASMAFLKDVAAWVRMRFSKADFPPDVTLVVFHHIQEDGILWDRYLKVVSDETGERDSALVTSLHRRIGRMVKRVLGAEVFGRSLPLDPDEHLIQSHALLRPGDG
jgi:hypothetical protein